MGSVNSFAFLVILSAILLFAGCTGTGLSPQSIVYQKNADTLTTTGSMNIGVPKDFYFANQADASNVPVDGSSFANASGQVHVEISPSTKFCSYRLYKETGFITNSLWDTYYGAELTNDLKYNVKVTQPDGHITTQNGISPFDMSNKQIQLASNPDRPLVPVIMTLNGEQAALGEGSCDDRNNFVILKVLGNVVVLKKSAYTERINALGLGLINAYDLLSALTNPSSAWRYDKPMDTSNLAGLSAKYQENRLGDAVVQVTVPYWAFNTVVFTPAAQGRAQVSSCSVTKAASGQQTYVNLIYTNIGETSKFFYTLSSPDYSISGGSNSGGRIQSGSQQSEIFAVTANNVGMKSVTVSMAGESGITTQAVCQGEIVSSNSGLQPPPIPGQNNTIIPTAQCAQYFEKVVYVTEGGFNFLGMNFLGKQVGQCVPDYTTIGAVFALFGLVVFILGFVMKEQGEPILMLGAAIMAIGVIFLFLSVIIENSMEIFIAGIGLGIIAIIGLGVYLKLRYL